MMCSGMVFYVVIPFVLRAYSTVDTELSLEYSIPYPDLISITLDLLALIILFTILSVVKFPVLMGVAGCGCHNSFRILCRFGASWALRNNPPSSASAADAITFCNVLRDICTGTYDLVGVAGAWWSGTDLDIK